MERGDQALLIGTDGALLRALWQKMLLVGALIDLPLVAILTTTTDRKLCSFTSKLKIIPYNILTIRPTKFADKHAAYYLQLPTGDPGRKRPTLLLDLQDPTTRLPEAYKSLCRRSKRTSQHSKQHGGSKWRIPLELSSTTGASYSRRCICICHIRDQVKDQVAR